MDRLFMGSRLYTITEGGIMNEKLRECIEGFLVILAAFGVAIGGLLVILICQPFFWLAVIALILIYKF